MTVAPKLFTQLMTDRWVSFGIVPSVPLQKLWSTNALIFNDQTLGQSNNRTTNIKVIQAETGTGKTQGLAVYCSLLPSDSGVLIVTRTKVQADEVATIVNEVTGRGIAAAHHGDNELTDEEMQKHQVLVVTHSKYLLAVENSKWAKPESLNKLMTWDKGIRKLTVIDEAPEFIKSTQLTLDFLSQALGNIPNHIKQKYPAPIKALVEMHDGLNAIADDQKKTNNGNHIVRRKALDNKEDYDMTELIAALRANNEFVSDKTKDRTIETIKSAKIIAGNWCIYLKEGKHDSLNTARSIWPDNISNIVILDATAAFNPVYDLLENTDIPTLPKTRSYSNVTLQVAKIDGAGKHSMHTKRAERADKLATYLSHNFRPDQSVFLCCHKAVEHSLCDYDLSLENFNVDHWGNIDGRNDWKDFDTAVIYGLPFLPSSWASMMHATLYGLPNEAWLEKQEGSSVNADRKTLQRMETDKVTTSIIQAMNRVRCRKVIDGEGNCATTDVYILLPKTKQGDQLLSNIQVAMPGIKQEEWKIILDASRERVRKSAYEETLVTFMLNSSSGDMLANHVRDQIGASKRTWARITAKLKDKTSDIYKRLEGLSVYFSSKGKGAKAYFVKLQE